MSVVSSTDVECFRRLTNPEIVDVNGAGTTTRQIAHQMRQAMEQVVAAAQSSEAKARAADSSDEESEQPARDAASEKPTPVPPSSRLALAMQAAREPTKPPPPEPRKTTDAETPSPKAATPSSLPVSRFLQPPLLRASSPSEEFQPEAKKEDESAKEPSEDGDEDARSSAPKDPESLRLEKQGYLIELHALQSKGVRLSREFGMKDSLTELEFEVQKQSSILSTTSAVANMRDMMRIGFNGVEMCNSKFGPFLCLDGWAESITSDMKRFDGALEKLYKRYWRKQQMSPIMELGMIILGSLAMHHFKTKLFGPVRPPPRTEPAHAAAPPPQPHNHAQSSPSQPRLRKGTPPNVQSSVLGAQPSRNQAAAGGAAGRPTLRPPAAMFGFGAG